MTITLDPVQLLLGGAAALVAIGLLARKLRQLDRLLHAAASVIHRELDQTSGDTLNSVLRRQAATVAKELRPNGGESIKDDVTALAVGLGYLGRGFDQLSERVDALEHPNQETTA